MDETPLDHAHRAMAHAPHDDAKRLAWYHCFADTELCLLLTHEPEGETLSPALFELSEGRFALTFDLEERLADFADGTLEQMSLSPNSLSVLVAAKILAHWLLSGLPLVLLAPVLGLQFDLTEEALWTLTIGLLLGTPVLSLIGAVGAALTLGVRGGDVLLSLLILPLYVPALIFGAGAVQAQMSGLGAAAHLSILAAMALVAAVFSPWVSAASLRIALES